MRRPHRLVVVLLLAAWPALPVSAAPAGSGYSGPTIVGELAAPPRQETSGLAVSRRDPGVLWTHDDSGGKAALYAITTTGANVGTLKISGTTNEDWEDLASFELDGKSWLLIADTGDNDARRPTVLLHVVEEPSLADLKAAGELKAKPARTLRVRYEDGPRDCESVAIDPNARMIYLLTKRDAVPRLYRVELEPKDGNALVLARHVGDAVHLPRPSAAQRGFKGYLGRRRGEPTAMDFRSDGTAALVLTYGGLWLYPRQPGESWPQALARDPVPLPPHPLLQAEAACFSADGRRIYLAAESDLRLLRYDAP
jgi:hypothetical protein